MNQRTAIHDRVLNAADKDELAAAYAEWAEGYDHDLLDELGYVAPMTATRLLTSMLAKAREKAAYAMLMQGDLMARLSIDDATYDAVISVGTFTCAHVGPQALNELVRITRPGGCICFTVRDQAWEEDDYRGAIETLVDSGDWKRLDEVEAPYIEKEGSDCRICVYQVAR
jgi:predicted TPR repeat methyltransferase